MSSRLDEARSRVRHRISDLEAGPPHTGPCVACRRAPARLHARRGRAKRRKEGHTRTWRGACAHLQKGCRGDRRVVRAPLRRLGEGSFTRDATAAPDSRPSTDSSSGLHLDSPARVQRAARARTHRRRGPRQVHHCGAGDAKNRVRGAAERRERGDSGMLYDGVQHPTLHRIPWST